MTGAQGYFVGLHQSHTPSSVPGGPAHVKPWAWDISARSASPTSRSPAKGWLSKAGLLGLTRTLAIWAAEHGITVNAVAPGSIEAEWINQTHTEQEIRDVVKRTPLRRMGTPADIGELVVFLASEAAGHMTGCVIETNGGQWIGS